MFAPSVVALTLLLSSIGGGTEARLIRGIEADLRETPLAGYRPLEIQSSWINVTATPVEDSDPALLQADDVSGQIHYTLGARFAGDRLVGQAATKTLRWPTPQNTRIIITYPASGVGAKITYVSIPVDQSSSQGKAYVVQGGLNQRMISVAVEAYNVVYVSYSVQIYGLP